MFLEATLFILLMTALSLLIQDKFNIPTPITLISTVMALKLFNFSFIEVNNHIFDQILILMLPILLSVDALSLKIRDIQRHAMSLFYVAVLMVLLSTVAAVSLDRFILPEYNLSIAALVVLFCMILPTDPISVSASFGKNNVPHHLKIIAEGESLFNDATALIMFSIGIYYLNSTEPFSFTDMTIVSFKVIVGAIITGIIIGFAGVLALNITKNPKAETAIILAIAFASYMIAEHFHFSGILAVIVSILTSNYVLTARIEKDEEIINMPFTRLMFRKLQEAVKDKAGHETVIANVQYIALIGTTILFVSMADIVNIDLLVKHWREIIAVFVATTVIRMLMLAKFSFISNNVKQMHNISFHWWMILSAAGVKGAISVLMLHMLPRDFEHKELFEAIVVGNVILTTFVYPVIIMLVLKIYKETFDAEYQKEIEEGTDH